MKLNFKNFEDLCFFITMAFASIVIGFSIISLIAKIFLLSN
jgi:hypothetical protein